MNGEAFFKYMLNPFIKWVEQEKIKLPIVVFLDGHRSHMTYNLSPFCALKQLVLISLYPNTTHILQLLDVALFYLLKQNWGKCVRDWKMSPQRKDGEVLTKYNFAPPLKFAFDQTFKGNIVSNGFKACGLYPFDEDAVDYSKCNVLKHKTVERADVDEGFIHHKSKDCLGYLETFINPQTLKLFQETYMRFTPVWSGDTAAHDLYVAWKKMKDEKEKSSPVLQAQVKPVGHQPECLLPEPVQNVCDGDLDIVSSY